jgi:hypothetical protein
MAERSVVGVYESLAQAEEVVHTLDRAGFPVQHVSIVTQPLVRDQALQGSLTPGAASIPHDAATGAWVGGLSSLLVGVSFLWAPGFGPLLVLGHLASLLLLGAEGALVGAAAGSFLGTLADWGMTEEHTRDYAQQVQRGKHLVIASGMDADVARAHALLQGTPAGTLRVHADAGVERPSAGVGQGISSTHAWSGATPQKKGHVNAQRAKHSHCRR